MARKLFKFGLGGALAAGVATAAALGAAPAPAHACGGLFCSSSNPVNQAAEQIIFVDNKDGSVTMAIQILYEGPSSKFAWVLPVPGNPTVGVSSDAAFDAIKQATNPQYQLQTRFADGCQFPQASPASGAAGGAGGSAMSPSDSGVSVVASGAIGPYVYDTIAVDSSLSDPADAAVKWLGDNGYDVGMIGPDVLRPYLADGLNLIAFKLNKTSNSGSIRPVLLTYQDAKPSIPIRPTAVAANDDMGVMVFLLSDARGIPENYKALELNDALIDWFMPNRNYNEVVTRAADEAMGQGFVTEFAGPHQSPNMQQISIFPPWQRDMWQQFQAMQHPDGLQMIEQAMGSWGAWDGFDDALQKALTLPQDVAFSDFKNCMRCYSDEPGFVFSTSTFLRQLYELVIKPMQDTQALLDSRPYLTRLYTTMSADEMTMDPVFAFNPDLDDVSNIHTATQLMECGTSGNPFGADAPWSVELPQGTVRGSGNSRVWPIDIESQPAAIRIMQFGTSGEGKVLEDRTDAVSQMIKDAAPTKPTDPTMPMAGSTGTGGSGGSSGPKTPVAMPTGGKGGASAPGLNPTTGNEGVDDVDSDDKDGCSVAGSGGGSNLLTLLALAALALVRRRRGALS